MKLPFRLHKTVIIIVCVALITFLMHGVSYLGYSQSQSRLEQFKQLTQVLAEQVAFSLSDYMVPGSKDFNLERINANLNHLAKDHYILDASLYTAAGALVTQIGEPASVKERLSLDGKSELQNFHYQLVIPVQGAQEPKGYLRLTIDTESLTTDLQQADNTANIMRVFILLSLCIGFILANTLMRLKKKKGQQQLIVEPDENTEESEDKLKVQSNGSKGAHMHGPLKSPRAKRRKEPSPHRPRRVARKLSEKQ
ncbi:AhpA/YtjB family protein [Providencia sp. wls1914]|uniref:AhpA/YtjB family protein n=1 Tax=Providencia sp. wls1914 TaxID=2675156 RepID=UPI0012B615E4|nr:AhpA/YtjB family protein [Providencia sp. wls1914]MTC70251.1 protein smp [Providencia sp. wls1914]